MSSGFVLVLVNSMFLCSFLMFQFVFLVVRVVVNVVDDCNRQLLKSVVENVNADKLVELIIAAVGAGMGWRKANGGDRQQTREQGWDGAHHRRPIVKNSPLLSTFH